MAFTKEEVTQIGDIVVEVTTPMFEHVIETLGGRIDRVELRLDGVESELHDLQSEFSNLQSEFSNFQSEFRDLKSETRSKFAALEQKLDDQTLTIQERLGYMEQDITFLYQLVEKLEHGTPAEKKFAKMTIEKQLPIMYRSLQAIAKKAGVELPQSS